jgi:hypothetical protein
MPCLDTGEHIKETCLFCESSLFISSGIQNKTSFYIHNPPFFFAFKKITMLWCESYEVCVFSSLISLTWCQD